MVLVVGVVLELVGQGSPSVFLYDDEVVAAVPVVVVALAPVVVVFLLLVVVVVELLDFVGTCNRAFQTWEGIHTLCTSMPVNCQLGK